MRKEPTRSYEFKSIKYIQKADPRLKFDCSQMQCPSVNIAKY